MNGLRNPLPSFGPQTPWREGVLTLAWNRHLTRIVPRAVLIILTLFSVTALAQDTPDY